MAVLSILPLAMHGQDIVTGFLHSWLGLNYAYAFQGKAEVYINQYNLGAFKNYSYSYDFSRQSLMAVIKADIWRSESGFMPYLLNGGYRRLI